jgi:hypothetical protein
MPFIFERTLSSLQPLRTHSFPSFRPEILQWWWWYITTHVHLFSEKECVRVLLCVLRFCGRTFFISLNLFILDYKGENLWIDHLSSVSSKSRYILLINQLHWWITFAVWLYEILSVVASIHSETIFPHWGSGKSLTDQCSKLAVFAWKVLCLTRSCYAYTSTYPSWKLKHYSIVTIQMICQCWETAKRTHH